MSYLCMYTLVCVQAKLLNHVQLFVAPWTIDCQAPLSMGFSRLEYWSGLPLPTQGIFLTQGFNLRLLHLLHFQVDSLSLAPPGKPTYMLKYSHMLAQEMTIHSNILAWKIPWTEEPGQLQFVGSQRVKHNSAQHSTAFSYMFALFQSLSRAQLLWATLVGCHFLLPGIFPTQG